ncbi:hypothetical protein AU188_16865 [Mycobacterium sp. IS-3022]|nr:hypothetical protein AU188_16865 [Mycobacterium sp. IS-3022]
MHPDSAIPLASRNSVKMLGASLCCWISSSCMSPLLLSASDCVISHGAPRYRAASDRFRMTNHGPTPSSSHLSIARSISVTT